MAKIVSAAYAASCIPDGANVAVGGFCGFGSPDEVLAAIRERFEKEGKPANITVLKGVSVGDHGVRGCNRLAAKGLVGRIISGHVGLEPEMAKLVSEGGCLAYMLPLGTLTELFRAAASRSPGVLTTCGMDTFVDPRIEGGKANQRTKDTGPDLAQLMELGDRQCLFYPTIPIHACVVRGTYADEDGNISMAKEALFADQFEAAAAAHNSGGIVIVQVEDIVKRGTIPPAEVKLHHFMVDYVVKARPENHTQGFDSPDYRPELTGTIRKPTDALAPMPLSERKICGRRALMELKSGALINLGIGMPDAVAAAAAEEGLAGEFTLSIESGVLGGVPLGGLGLGASVNPEAMYKMADILNIYDGGGLDATVLGLAEIDCEGNVNVSRFGGSVTGPGGFIDISQNTKKVIFIGTFTAGGLKVACEDGRLRILSEGRNRKFRQQVEQITFSAKYARRHDQQVLVVTERAVFRLTNDGLLLTELAPGVDLERDVLAHMDFRPCISSDLRSMDPRIFRSEAMGLTL